MSDADIILDDLVEAGRLVTLAEVKKMLEQAQEEREELTYEQKIAMEHARRFARLDLKTAEKLLVALKKGVPGVEEKYLFRVVDLLPHHEEDVRAIFQKSRVDISAEQVESIIELVDAHYTA
jgi:DNA-directed RNA polymerase subunit F